jgi:hypothetical protein
MSFSAKPSNTSSLASDTPADQAASNPKLALLPRGGQIVPAGSMVDQVDDDVPHDRTLLTDGRSITKLRFRLLSSIREMVSLSRGIVSSLLKA